MSRRDPLVLLEDIMLAIQKIGRYTAQLDHDAFLNDELVIDARIASVRITTGDSAPGPDDDEKHDIVMMDNFIYGEPQPLP